MDERFAENCRKEAEHCRRQAERAMSPVCTENLIRVADVMESPKLAE